MNKSSFAYEDLISCSEGKLFGPGNPQLPAPPMLMFDRVSRVQDTGGEYGKGFIEAELDVNKDLWFFKCHFIGDSVMPGCLGVDALWQLLGFFLGWRGGIGRGRALGSSSVRFSSQVLPDARLLKYRVDIRKIMQGKLYLGIGHGTMTIDDKLAYDVKDLRVGLFTGS